MKFIIPILLLILLQSCKPKIKLDTTTMEPSIPLGSFLTIDFEAYKNTLPNRFDIVIFEVNLKREKRVYRIVGLPNETVEVDEGFVQVNGKTLKIPSSTKYFKGTIDANFPKVFNKVVLKENEFYLLADSKTALDSRYIGPIKRNQILGKVIKVEKPK